MNSLGFRIRENILTMQSRRLKYSGLIGIFLAVIVLYVFLQKNWYNNGHKCCNTYFYNCNIQPDVFQSSHFKYHDSWEGLRLGRAGLLMMQLLCLKILPGTEDEGMSLKEAVIRGTGQVGGAITASTITTIVVFLPIVYLHGLQEKCSRIRHGLLLLH